MKNKTHKLIYGQNETAEKCDSLLCVKYENWKEILTPHVIWHCLLREQCTSCAVAVNLAKGSQNIQNISFIGEFLIPGGVIKIKILQDPFAAF